MVRRRVLTLPDIHATPASANSRAVTVRAPSRLVVWTL